MVRGLTVGWLCLVLTSVAVSGENTPAFTQRPTAVKTGETVKLEFAVDRETDATVTIEDAKGNVVNHLVSGLLGKNPPAPLKPGLSQSLVWDGKDDRGEPAAGGPFKVRVALGLTPTFDRLIGHNPAWLGSVVGIAADPNTGDLFVLHVFGALHPGDGSTACTVFSREGRYRRTILPWPANVPEEGLAGLKRVDLDGRKIPFIYQGETRNLLPGVGNLEVNGPVVTAEGMLVFVNHHELCSSKTRYNRPGVKQVTVIRTADGSLPADGLLKTVLAHDSQAAAMLAVAPDGKTWYAARVHEGHAGKPSNPHAVHRFTLGDAESKPFIGDPATAGAGPDRLNSPTDVAVDKDGNLYVADKGNDRVAVFKPDGSFLGALTVEKPERVEVHPRSGAVYVLGGVRVNELRKFASWRDSQPAAQATLPSFKHEAYTAVMALDASADTPLLWVGSPQGYYARFTLLRIEDKGQAFGDPVDVARRAGPSGVGPVTDLSLERRSERLYASARGFGRVFDGRSGKPLDLQFPKLGGSGNVAAIGADGNFYLYHNYPSAAVSRFTPTLKALPFAGRASISDLGSPRVRGRGLTADRDGKVYILWQKPKEKQTKGDAEDANALALYDKDGRLIKDKLIDSDMRSINSVRVDPAGNIYLAVGARPAGLEVPESFAGQDLGRPWFKGNTNEINWYHLMYGSIVKFGPGGGEIRQGTGGVPMTASYAITTEVRGAEWIFYGASPVPSWRQKYPDTCLCESPRFDVDDFGRSFFPDACRFRVGVIDTAGNEVCWFGSYGNQDSAGPGSAIPVPAIALCWPHAVAVGDEAVYVGDRLNRRVVRVKLTYAAEATCAVSR